MNKKKRSIVNRSSIGHCFFKKKKNILTIGMAKKLYINRVCMYNQMNKSKVCGVSLRGYLIF